MEVPPSSVEPLRDTGIRKDPRIGHEELLAEANIAQAFIYGKLESENRIKEWQEFTDKFRELFRTDAPFRTLVHSGELENIYTKVRDHLSH